MVTEHNLDASKAQKLARLKVFLNQDPDNLALIGEIISLCVELKEWHQAETLAMQALEHHPSSPPINAHAGFIFLRQGKAAEAAACFKKAVEAGIIEPPVLYNAAVSCYSLGDFEGALRYLSLLSEPGDLLRGTAMLAARSNHHLGNLENAGQELSKFVNAHPEDIEAHGLLALILYDQGFSEKSLHHANRACDADRPPLEGLLARGSVYLEMGQHDLAFRDFSAVTQEYPEAAGRAWSGIGQIEFNNFEMDSAVSALTKAVDTMPNHIGTWHLLGWAYLMKNNLDAALSSFEKAYELDRNFAETHGGLASVYSILGDITKAQKHIKLAERLDPNGFASIYARMILLNKDGKQEQATALFEKTKQAVHPVLGVAPEKLINARLEELTKQNKSKQLH